MVAPTFCLYDTRVGEREAIHRPANEAAPDSSPILPKVATIEE